MKKRLKKRSSPALPTIEEKIGIPNAYTWAPTPAPKKPSPERSEEVADAESSVSTRGKE